VQWIAPFFAGTSVLRWQDDDRQPEVLDAAYHLHEILETDRLGDVAIGM
jgi:hypothetical protein